MTSATTPVEVIVHFIHRHFIWIIVSSYIVAAVLPGFGLGIRNLNLGSVTVFQGKLVFSLPPIMLASLLFNAGLGVRTAELKHMLRKPLVLLGGVFGNVAAPMAFIMAVSFAMRFWHNPEEVQQILVGLALVASMPIAGASTAWSQNANGNLALSLGLVLATTLLSPLLTPMVLHAVGFVTTCRRRGRQFSGCLGHPAFAARHSGPLGRWGTSHHSGDAVFEAHKLRRFGLAQLLERLSGAAHCAVPTRPRLSGRHAGNRHRTLHRRVRFRVSAGAGFPIRPQRNGFADVRAGDEQQWDGAGDRINGLGRPPASDVAHHLLQPRSASCSLRGGHCRFSTKPTVTWHLPINFD